MLTNRPIGLSPTKVVIDLTTTEVIATLLGSLTEQLTVTDAEQRAYQKADTTLTSLAHRSRELISRVFDPLDVSEPESELQAA